MAATYGFDNRKPTRTKPDNSEFPDAQDFGRASKRTKTSHPTLEEDSASAARQNRKNGPPRSSPSYSSNSKHKYRPQSHPYSTFSSATASRDRTSLSAKIHNLRRLLTHPRSAKMPATMRRDKERELAAYMLEQDSARQAKLRQKLTSKYHFVRFVERQKAERALKRLKARAEKEIREEVRQDLEKRIHDLEVDVAYTIYAPLGEKYLALYPQQQQQRGSTASGSKKEKADDSGEDVGEDVGEQQQQQQQEGGEALEEVGDVLRAEKPATWKVVEKLLAEGDKKGLERLRNGSVGSSRGVDKEKKKSKGNKMTLETSGERKSSMARMMTTAPTSSRGKGDWMQESHGKEGDDVEEEKEYDDDDERRAGSGVSRLRKASSISERRRSKDGGGMDFVAGEQQDNSGDDDDGGGGDSDMSDGGFFERA